jgi:hypothetical protein
VKVAVIKRRSGHFPRSEAYKLIYVMEPFGNYVTDLGKVVLTCEDQFEGQSFRMTSLISKPATKTVSP